MNVQQKLTVLATIVCVVLLLGGAQVILLSTENDTALAATPAGQLRSSALEEYKNADQTGEKYQSHWGTEGGDWSLDFLYYCADTANLVGEDKPLGEFTRDYNEVLSRLKNQEAAIYSAAEAMPQPGDLVFFYKTTTGHCAEDVSGEPENLCRVGIVVSFMEKELAVLSGNDQGRVRLRTYNDLCGTTNPDEAVWCFVRLAGGLENLTDFVCRWEGFAKYPIWDYAQWSVGYGTRCPDDKLEYYKTNGITIEEAKELLAQYIDSSIQSVESYCKREGLNLTYYQRDALVSLTYNIGAGWMSNGYESLERVIANPYDPDELVETFAGICHAGGKILPALVERRICEAWLFLTGEYVKNVYDTDYDYAIRGGQVYVYKSQKEDNP